MRRIMAGLGLAAGLFAAGGAAAFPVDAAMTALAATPPVAMVNGKPQDWAATLDINIARLQTTAFPPVGRYIVVNIPSAELQAWEDGRLVLASPVVVGKPSTPTPVMVSDLYAVKYNPDWTVAPTLTRKYLEHLRRGNYAELHRHGVLAKGRDGRVVPVTAVTADEFRTEGYRFWQPPGASNALGLIKFEMDNPDAIYLHDTNERGLFAKASRAKSSGCVRVRDYEQLAAWVSDVPVEEIRTRVQSKRTMTRSVERVPVYLTYFTALPDAGGTVRFYPDVYGLDKLAVAGL